MTRGGGGGGRRWWPSHVGQGRGRGRAGRRSCAPAWLQRAGSSDQHALLAAAARAPLPKLASLPALIRETSSLTFSSQAPGRGVRRVARLWPEAPADAVVVEQELHLLDLVEHLERAYPGAKGQPGGSVCRSMERGKTERRAGQRGADAPSSFVRGQRLPDLVDRAHAGVCVSCAHEPVGLGLARRVERCRGERDVASLLRQRRG